MNKVLLDMIQFPQSVAGGLAASNGLCLVQHVQLLRDNRFLLHPGLYHFYTGVWPFAPI